MSVLDLKLLRDIRRLWAQALAIALVIAGGVATLVLAVGSYRSLEETRTAYYERNRFPDVFAVVSRAPKATIAEALQIPGVAAAEARVMKYAMLDVPAAREPATGQFISLPDGGQPELSQLYLRQGRLPEPQSSMEVVVNEAFAKAHGFGPGSRFSAILNGHKRPLTIVGIALSPEFIYAIGPGDIMPDDRRFGIVWMPEKALSAAYDLEGAFSSLNLKLLRNASEREVIRRLDLMLDPYGGRAAYGRKDQMSHAFLDHELDMLSTMSRTLPPIFLFVAGFLINVTLGRLVALEREQIGLFKAIGYTNLVVASHYIKFVIVIALIGTTLGIAAGTWLGIWVAGIFRDYFHFPYLVFVKSPDLYAVAAAVSLAAAALGAYRATREIISLSPAVAMQPPAPPHYRRLLPFRADVLASLSQTTTMMVRNIMRRPIRSALTTVGMALSVAILIASLFVRDSLEQLIDSTFFRSERQDATLSFVEKRPAGVVYAAARLPGVLAVESYREVPARIRFGAKERRLAISGRSSDADLNRLLDTDLRPVAVPEIGLALSEMLARVLGVRVGNFVEVDLLDGATRTVEIPVVEVFQNYLGLRATMSATSLARLMREAPAVNGVHLALDEKQFDAFYATVKGMPAVSGVALQRVSLAKFRETLALNVTVMASIYTVLAGIIAFGVVYNVARISLSERARELASLRVLGFTRGEVFRILLSELVLLTILAQAPGWALGYSIAWIMRKNMEGELMRIPLVIERPTYALASLIVIVAASLSSILLYRRIRQLDLVAVLKTRD